MMEPLEGDRKAVASLNAVSLNEDDKWFRTKGLHVFI